MIQLLNIAGTGPIFGAIMGAMFGPSCYLWIVLGCIFGGAVHDYMTGMLSIRGGGVVVSDVVGNVLGKGAKNVMLVFSVEVFDVAAVQILSFFSRSLEVQPILRAHSAGLRVVSANVIVFDEDMLLVDDFCDVLAVSVRPEISRDVCSHFDGLVWFVIVAFFHVVILFVVIVFFIIFIFSLLGLFKDICHFGLD